MLKTACFRIFLGLYAAAVLVHCGASPTGSSPDGGDGGSFERYNASARFTVNLGKVGVLSKASAINLKKLVLVAVSTGTPADTVRDTVQINGNDAISVQRLVKLKPLLSWSLRARTLDQRDSVIHLGESQLFSVKPGDTTEVKLTLASRFTMYQAVFSNLPSTLSTAQGPDRMGLNLNKLVLKIDGQVRGDSTLSRDTYFQGGQNVTVTFDYVTPGSHTVSLEAYGLIGDYSGLLFAGGGAFTSTGSEDGSQPITLNWVGPSTGTEKVSIILGRIGKVVLTGGFNSTL